MPPDPPPTAQFNFPAPPERVRRDGGSTSYGKLDPRQEANLADQDKITQDQIDLERRKLEAKNRTAQIQGEQANTDSKTAEDFHAVREKAIESSATEISAARDRLRANQAKYDAMPPASLFGGQGTAGQIAMSIGLAMGAYSDGVKAAAAIRLQRDAGASTVDGIIKHSFDRQRESAERVKDSVAMARTGIKDAGEAREALLADIDLKEASAYKVAERMTKARLASQGKTANQIEADEHVIGFKKGRSDAQAKTIEVLGKRITTDHSNTVNYGGPVANANAIPQVMKNALLSRDGKTIIGTAPVEAEAGKTRDQRTALEKAGANAEKLKALLFRDGKISPWSSLQGERDGLIASLTDARKEITGAVTADDIKRYSKQLDTAWNRDPKTVGRVIDNFMGDLGIGYDAAVKSAAAGTPLSNALPTATPPPQKPISEYSDAEIAAMRARKAAK